MVDFSAKQPLDKNHPCTIHHVPNNMDVGGDQHDANIEPEIESSEMQDRGGADFGFHSLLIHNNNCEGHDESDEDSFDLDDGFCSVDDDASLFDKWEDEEDLDVWN